MADENNTAVEMTGDKLGEFKQTERPKFEKPVKAVVKEAKLFVNPKIEISGDGDKTQRAYLQVSYGLEAEHVFKSGQKTKEVFSNYGLKVYINGEGAAQTKVIYWGKKADSATLKGLLIDQTGMSKTADVKTILDTLKGKKVMLKTEDRQNPEDKSINPKVLISQFLPD